MAQQGTVKFFNFTKGFGFINPANGGDDMFVHINDVSGNPLKEGDEVTYDVNFDERKGKEHAVNVAGGSGWPMQDKGMGKGKGGFGGGYNNGGGYNGGW